MANYALTINSTFQPFSYQELVAPVAHQQQVQDAIVEQYDKLSSQADVLEAMGANDRDKNSGTYSRYKAYSDQLRKEADNLYRFGLNSESRQRLSDLRRMYNTEIVPIQNAWNKREEESKMQMQAYLQNPSLMFTRDASTSSLDDYIKNPTGGFGVINGANITAQMSAMAKNLEKQILDGSVRKEDIDGFTYDYIREYGLRPDLIRNWRNSDTLRKMYEQVMQANGVTPEALQNSANAQNIIDKSTGYAEMGMWNAMGEDKTHIQEDYIARLNAQTQAKIAEEMAKHPDSSENSAESLLDDSVFQLPMQGADYSNAKEQENAMGNLGYVKKDGKLMFTGKVTLSSDSKNRTDRILELNQKEIEQGMLSQSELEERSRLQNLSRSQYGRTPKEYNLYNKNGKIMTREQFVSQGSTEEEKQELQRYYSKIVEANQTLGLKEGSYNSKELANHYNTLRKSNAAQMANVRALNYEKADWNPTSKQYPVREIKGYRKGQPQFDTKPLSLGELLEKQDSNKNDIVAAPYWSDVEGQEGLIFATTEDGKAHRYFISAEDMPESNVQRARQMFREVEALKEAGRTAAAKKRLETALAYLHTGLTMHNKGYEQSIVRQPTLKQQGLAE